MLIFELYASTQFNDPTPSHLYPRVESANMVSGATELRPGVMRVFKDDGDMEALGFKFLDINVPYNGSET